ncbi:MAG: translocation/assembly module TamB domain-containing protein [Xanthobacteraceae bacterium]
MRALLRPKRIGVLAALTIGLVAVLISTLLSRGSEDEKGLLAGVLSRALSTPATQVAIGEVEGALSSNAVVRNVTIADRDGVWLHLDQVRLTWRRSALLLRRLEVDRLEVGTLTIHRRPVPADQPASDTDEPLLPELPLKVDIKDFSLRELALGAPVVGVAARLTGTGAASLGNNPSEGLNLRLDARRLDAAGTLTARLALWPQTERLDLTLSVHEPENGILANALNIPDQPPVSFDLTGSGTLDAFAARLVFDAGAGIGATGSARLQRQADARLLSLDLAAQIEGLLPDPAAAVFAGTTRLDGAVAFADGGAIDVRTLTLMSRTARLDVKGQLSAARIAQLSVSARSLNNAGTATNTGDPAIGRLAFDASVAGPISGPRIDATLDADNIAAPQGKLAKLVARFSAAPNGDGAQAKAIPFTANAEASGLKPADPALARALGDTVTLTLAGQMRDGVADLQTARLRLATADSSFTGRIGRSELQGRLTLAAPDLANFSDLASRPLRGRLGVTADLTGVPKKGRIEAAIDGRASDLATGVAAVDGLLGGRLAVNGTIRKHPKRGFGFGNLRLTGAHVSAQADGDATTERASIEIRFTVPELRHADARLSGRAEAIARLTGSIDRPDGIAAITVSDASALGRPIPRLALEANGSDLTGALDAQVTLSGEVDRKPAHGALRLARPADGGWRVDALDLRIGSVTVQGDVTLDARRLAEGRLTIAAGNLDDLSPLALTPMAGSLRADATATVSDGGQNGTVNAEADNVKIGASTLHHLTARGDIRDVYRRPVIDADVSIDRADIAGEAVSQLRLNAQGAAYESTVALTAQARGFTLDARGRLVPADTVRFELAALNVRRGEHRVALLQPATLTLLDRGIDIQSLKLALDRGKLAIDGRVGPTLDVTVAAQSVPLALSETVMPELGLSGTLDGEAKITGPVTAPTGRWRARLGKLVTPQSREFGLPALDVGGSGQLVGRASTVDATVQAASVGTLRIAGTVPFGDGVLDLAIKGAVDLAVANQRASVAGRRVTGKAEIDLKLGGSLAGPEVGGTVTIANGTYSDAALGIRLSNIAGRLVARGAELFIEQLRAQMPDGGTVTAQGQARIDAAAGFPGVIRISGQPGKLVANDVVEAVAGLSLTISGPLARTPQVSGRVDVVSLEVTIPERLPTTLRPIDGTRHVAPPPAAAARLALAEQAKLRAGRTPAFDAALDLMISAPNRVFLRGRGIDAELGGDIQVRGPLSSPVTTGAFQLRRGRMSIAGSRLDFTRGRILFAGSLTPDLDLAAQTTSSDITATITISGPATQPGFVFSSQPELPQEEVLSRLLFSKATGALSPVQALQLAQVAAQFSDGGGNDVFERLRRTLGVDNLDITFGANGSPQVGVSRALTRRVSVGVRTGSEVKDSAISVDIDVTKNVRIQGGVDRQGRTDLGIGVEWEY